MLDNELAALCGVETGHFNRAMKRNAAPFPADVALRLTHEEWEALGCQIGTLKTGGRGQRRKDFPRVFTEHGAILAATVLNSARAVAPSVHVVRAFARIRREVLASSRLEARLQIIGKNLLTHDAGLGGLYPKIRPLLLPPPEPPRRAIGCHTEN